MAIINSVTGPCDTKDLGFTLIHEHLIIGWSGWWWDNKYTLDRAGDMSKCVDMLQELKALGLGTFVDPAPMDIGRDPEFMAEASEKSGVRIIGSTGLYHHEMGIPSYFHGMSAEELAETFIADVQEGMAHSGIKAGIIKTATLAHSVSEQEAKVHAAAGMTQKATGAPIITHTDEAAPMGLAQLDIFEQNGADFKKVAIGHSCGNGDMTYLLNVLARGAWLSFDRFGFGISATDDLRIAMLMGLIGAGHADKVMIAHDSVCTVRARGGFNLPPEMAEKLKDWNPTHIFKNIIPRLKENGVSQETIDTITIDNPRRYFEGS